MLNNINVLPLHLKSKQMAKKNSISKLYKQSVEGKKLELKDHMDYMGNKILELQQMVNEIIDTFEGMMNTFTTIEKMEKKEKEKLDKTK